MVKLNGYVFDEDAKLLKKLTIFGLNSEIA